MIMVTKPIVLSFCALFLIVTLQTFLDILDNDLLKAFGSGQSSIMNGRKTNDCSGLKPYSTSKFVLCQPL